MQPPPGFSWGGQSYIERARTPNYELDGPPGFFVGTVPFSLSQRRSEREEKCLRTNVWRTDGFDRFPAGAQRSGPVAVRPKNQGKLRSGRQ